jgi:hypothetical protein
MLSRKYAQRMRQIIAKQAPVVSIANLIQSAV